MAAAAAVVVAIDAGVDLPCILASVVAVVAGAVIVEVVAAAAAAVVVAASSSSCSTQLGSDSWPTVLN